MTPLSKRDRSASEDVYVVGGPFSGARVPRSTDSLLLTGAGVPEGMVARYRWQGSLDQYVFDAYDKVVATIPRPGGES